MGTLFSGYEYETVKEAGYASNKDVLISRINEIEIENFRSLKKSAIKLGKHITILLGRNGTMKTSLLGLIAHPFSTNANDCFGKPLKTKMSEVFNLSVEYDGDYEYFMKLNDINGHKIRTRVQMYPDSKGVRHRVVVGGAMAGQGNFDYKTAFMSFSRLNPIVETKANNNTGVQLSGKEARQQLGFYGRVLPSKTYEAFEGVQEGKKKETFGPIGENVQYDYNSISSGEDNLGSIFNKMISFQRAKRPEAEIGNGVFCIDELEAGLHPAAQLDLFRYLLDWSKKHRVQVVFTTHSLYLIDAIYREYAEDLENEDVVANFISCDTADDDKNYPILYNPDKSIAYKELTLRTSEEVLAAQKIKLLCEDKCAEYLIKTLLQDEFIISKLEFITDCTDLQQGIPYTGIGTILTKICSAYPLLLDKAFAVFDADVGGMPNVLMTIQNNNTYTLLPDADNFPIEKRIAVFIVELPPNDSLFTGLNKTQSQICSEMAGRGIVSTPAIMRAELSVSKFKAWANSDERFREYVSYYVNSLDDSIRIGFKRSIIEKMNYIYEKSGLPCIECVE